MAELEDELIGEDLDYEEYELNEEQEEALLTENQDEAVIGHEEEDIVDNTHDLEEEDNTHESVASVQGSVHSRLSLPAENDNYIEFQNEDNATADDDENIVEEEEDEEEEEEESDVGGGKRDRFKSERAKISFTPNVKINKAIPDSLDDVIKSNARIQQAGKMSPARGGGGRGRGFNQMGNRRGGIVGSPMQQQLNHLSQPPPIRWPKVGPPPGPFNMQNQRFMPPNIPVRIQNAPPNMLGGPARPFMPIMNNMMPQRMPPQNFFPNSQIPWPVNMLPNPGYQDFTSDDMQFRMSSLKRPSNEMPGPGPAKQPCYNIQKSVQNANSNKANETLNKTPIHLRLSRPENKNPNLKTIQTVDFTGPQKKIEPKNQQKQQGSKDDSKNAQNNATSVQNNVNRAPKNDAKTAEEDYQTKLKEQKLKRDQILAKKEMRRKVTASQLANKKMKGQPNLVQKQDADKPQQPPGQNKIPTIGRGVARPPFSPKFKQNRFRAPGAQNPQQLIANRLPYSHPERVPEPRFTFSTLAPRVPAPQGMVANLSSPPPPIRHLSPTVRPRQAFREQFPPEHIHSQGPSHIRGPPPRMPPHSGRLSPPRSFPPPNMGSHPPPIGAPLPPPIGGPQHYRPEPHRPPLHRPPMHRPPMHRPPLHRPPMHRPPIHRSSSLIPENSLPPLDQPPPNMVLPHMNLTQPPPNIARPHPPPPLHLSQPPPHLAQPHSGHLPHRPPSPMEEMIRNDRPYDSAVRYDDRYEGQDMYHEDKHYNPAPDYEYPPSYEYNESAFQQEEQAYEDPYAQEQEQSDKDYEDYQPENTINRAPNPQLRQDLRQRMKQGVKANQMKVISPTVSSTSDYSQQPRAARTPYVISKPKEVTRVKMVPVSKRYKKITKRRNGQIVYIKRIHLDAAGKPTDKEEYEYINEELVSEFEYSQLQQTKQPQTSSSPAPRKAIVKRVRVKQTIEQASSHEFASYNEPQQQQLNRRQQTVNVRVGAKSRVQNRIQYQNPEYERVEPEQTRRVVTSRVQPQRRVLASGQSINSCVVKISDISKDFDINDMVRHMPDGPEEILLDESQQEYTIRFANSDYAYEFYESVSSQAYNLTISLA